MSGFITMITEWEFSERASARSTSFTTSLSSCRDSFRPTKEWDLLGGKGTGQLILALEAKSQVGPSFGNNFNNRTEEAMGSALCLWTAYREGAFNKTVRPWLGYMFLLTGLPGLSHAGEGQGTTLQGLPRVPRCVIRSALRVVLPQTRQGETL